MESSACVDDPWRNAACLKPMPSWVYLTVIPFYRWRNRDSEMSKDSLRLTQVVSHEVAL